MSVYDDISLASEVFVLVVTPLQVFFTFIYITYGAIIVYDN